MKITIKNVKTCTWMSEETLAFQADVYVDGQKAFTAENTGKGGANMYFPVKGKGMTVIREAEEYARSLPNFEWEGLTLKMDLDIYVDDLIWGVSHDRTEVTV